MSIWEWNVSVTRKYSSEYTTFSNLQNTGLKKLYILCINFGILMHFETFHHAPLLWLRIYKYRSYIQQKYHCRNGPKTIHLQKFGWDTIKQEFNAIMRFLFLSGITSVRYFTLPSVLSWDAKFLHLIQYHTHPSPVHQI